MPALNVEKLAKNRIHAIQQFHESVGNKKAELDVSGGIDSAVMLMLLSKALGPDNIVAVYSSIHSSQESLERARLVAKTANIHLIELDLSHAYDDIVAQCMTQFSEIENVLETNQRLKQDPTIKGSFRSCLRAPVGRFMNRLCGGGIRHGTGNEDEDRWLRFYQKGGDGEVDTNPMAMLSKGEVYQLAVYLGVPKELIICKPTPDLWGTGDEHNDEEELSKLSGVDWSYSKVDPETGKYIKVGTIEKMSRFIDEYNLLVNKKFPFFSDKMLAEYQYEDLLEKYELTQAHIKSAIKWEKSTRHKANPYCPTLGSREDLIEQEIVTNKLT